MIQYDMKSHLNITSRISLSSMIYCFVLLVLFSGYPYMFFQILPIPDIKIMACLFGVSAMAILLVLRYIRMFPVLFNICFCFQALSLLFFLFYHADSTYFTRIVIILIIYLLLLCLYNTDGGILGFFRIYNNIILLMSMMGLICFILLLIHPFEPISEFTNPDGRTGFFYGLSFTNYRIGNIIRFSGLFDEPGALAGWGIYALIINALFIHNYKFERVLSVCLLFTFSVAYYVQILLFYILLKNISLKNALCFILSISLVVLGVFLTKDTEVDLYRLTFYRFELNQTTGMMQGDNRTELAEKAKAQFVKYPLMGQGAKKISELDYMSDNPYETLAKDGILGTFITYLPLLIMGVVFFKNKSYIASLLILVVGYLQRPYHIDYLHPMMLYSLFLLMICSSNRKCEIEL